MADWGRDLTQTHTDLIVTVHYMLTVFVFYDKTLFCKLKIKRRQHVSIIRSNCSCPWIVSVARGCVDTARAGLTD